MLEPCSNNSQTGGSPRIRLGISACLLGVGVRYDGGHKNNPLLAEILADHVDFVPICPEVGCGLGVPRTPMRLEGDPKQPRLRTLPVVHKNGLDHTLRLRQWCQQQIGMLQKQGLDGFLFKSRSPSCGLTDVNVFAQQAQNAQEQTTLPGVGIFAQMLGITFPGLPMAEGDLLQDDQAVRAFLEILQCGNVV